jgi:ornithine cyclodeaminase/alanine dehydrogenase-like protein (mu-crystallin family)
VEYQCSDRDGIRETASVLTINFLVRTLLEGYVEVVTMAVKILKNRTMAEHDVISMAETIEVVEEAFAELGTGRAKNTPRKRIQIDEGGPKDRDDIWYWFNNILGAVPGCDSLALRIDSSLREMESIDRTEAQGERKMEPYPTDFVGLVLLFDIHTCELKAILDDEYISPLRVAATSAIGTDLLAREDASVVGMLGAGTQARAHAEALAHVRDLSEINVYSPTPESRAAFAADLDGELDATVTAVERPSDAVEDADIVNLATSAVDPVIDGEWLEPGMHVNSIVGGDEFLQRQEFDDETVRRADRIVVNLFEQVIEDRQGDLYPRMQAGLVNEADIDELADLVAGDVPGRQSEAEITLMKNNTGMGIQFAAAADRIYENVRGTDIGTELPAELFVTRNEAGYAP